MTFAYGDLCARIYDLDKPIGHSFGDVEHYTRRLAGVTGPILEPAVGTGRILIRLLRDGFDVRGYDLSEQMLAVCRTNAAREGVEASVSVGDMLTHRDRGAYQAVIVPCGSLILLPDRDAATTVLRNFHENLKPGGRLILDIPAPSFDSALPPMRHWWDDTDLLTMQTMHVAVDQLAQQVTQWLRYELWRDDTLVTTQLQIFRLLWFGLAEFTEMLRSAGFEDVAVVGDYSDDAPTSTSGIWTFEAIKPA